MKQPYREPLEHLHTQLVTRKESYSDLEDLRRETQRALEQNNDGPDEPTDLRARLEEAIERYSVAHPDLTRAAQQVLDVLTANGL